MNNKENFATKFGRFVGYVLFSCFSACVASILIALTVKIVSLIL